MRRRPAGTNRRTRGTDVASRWYAPHLRDATVLDPGNTVGAGGSVAMSSSVAGQWDFDLRGHTVASNYQASLGYFAYGALPGVPDDGWYSGMRGTQAPAWIIPQLRTTGYFPSLPGGNSDIWVVVGYVANEVGGVPIDWADIADICYLGGGLRQTDVTPEAVSIHTPPSNATEYSATSGAGTATTDGWVHEVGTTYGADWQRGLGTTGVSNYDGATPALDSTNRAIDLNVREIRRLTHWFVAAGFVAGTGGAARTFSVRPWVGVPRPLMPGADAPQLLWQPGPDSIV